MVTISLIDPVNKEGPTCPHCKGSIHISDLETGELVCKECGLVLNNGELDTGPEWRAYNTAELNRKKRTGLGLKNSIYDKGLATMLNGYKDYKGKALSEEERIKYLRLQKFNNRTKISDSWKRNLSIAFSELDRVCSILHMPDNIKENAAVIYRKVLKADLVRGRSIDAFVAACLYTACRLEKLPRSLNSIADTSTCDLQTITKHYRLMIREIDLDIPLDTPIKYLSSFASKMKVNSRVEQQSAWILGLARENNIQVGKNPKGVAAAALYLACLLDGEKVIQGDVADVSEVSAVTLRKRCKELRKLVDAS